MSHVSEVENIKEYIAISRLHRGRAKTPHEAVLKIRHVPGFDLASLKVYEVHEETTLTESGEFIHPAEHPPVEVGPFPEWLRVSNREGEKR